MTAPTEHAGRGREAHGRSTPAGYAASLFTEAHDRYGLSLTMQALDVVLTYRRAPHALTFTQLSAELLGDHKEMSRITGKARREHRRRNIQPEAGWEEIVPQIVQEVFFDAQLFSALDTPTIQFYLGLYPKIVAAPVEKRGALKTEIKRQLVDLVAETTSS